MSHKPSAQSSSIVWSQPERQAAFSAWLDRVAAAQGLQAASLRLASADASFRRYFRIDAADGGSRIIMDAPPEKENCQPFVQVASLLREAGVRVPAVLDWDQAGGFMLLDDLGDRTLLTALDPLRPADALPYFKDATTALLDLQRVARPDWLPAYDAALLQRELQLFPDWYLAQHKGVASMLRCAPRWTRPSRCWSSATWQRRRCWCTATSCRAT